MSETVKPVDKQMYYEEIKPRAHSGMLFLLLNIFLMIVSPVAVFFGINFGIGKTNLAVGIVLSVAGFLYFLIIGPILFAGLKVLKPNEALVLTLFGKYYGTLKGQGFYFVNPFVTATNPASSHLSTGTVSAEQPAPASKNVGQIRVESKKISIKTMTLNNDKQKVNDQLGNPIIIGIVVIWKVVNTAKAVFCVDNYKEFLSIQCDSALRNIVRLYPYDVSSDDNEKSLRGSSQEVAEKLKVEIQSKVEIAGLEISEARITHLSYAPEIAAAML